MTGTGSEVLSRVAEGVGWLTLNRPDKRNALNGALVTRLKDALREMDLDQGVRVVVIEGAGKDFCAGADLAELGRAAQVPVAENLADAESLGELFIQLRRLRKPVVAVVRGRALAGGCGLATACDLVLAAESARFGYPEVTIGFVPAMVMAILRRNLGEKRAFELICTGESIDAATAERLGLVNRVYADTEVEERSMEFVAALAERSATAVQAGKRLLYSQDSLGFESAIQSGAEVNVLARLTEDARSGIARFTGGSAEGT